MNAAAAIATGSPWIQMASGRPWPLLSPSPQDVFWPDIAEQVAKTNRFQGATPGVVYSAGQHCCHVCDILPVEARAYGLLHDAAEAVTGDKTSPFKIALKILGGLPAFEEIEHRTERAIFLAAGLTWPMPAHIAVMVKEADLRLLATEKRDLCAPAQMDWVPLPPPLPHVIKPWSWAKAADEWIHRFQLYVARVGYSRDFDLGGN